MSVWYAIPSARPADDVRSPSGDLIMLGASTVLQQWKDRGYKLAVWRDDYSWCPPNTDPSIALVGAYPGYAKAVNELVRRILELDPSADWIVTGGDDILPDQNHSADEIAEQCTAHFGNRNLFLTAMERCDMRTFGVMQPTGDRWGDEPWARLRWPDAPAYIDRICGSPWIGREFCKRAWNGQGPLHPGFTHMHVDEALQEYAKHLGILWQRRDLTQMHQHWGRKPNASQSDCPEFLRPVNTPEHWKESLALLDSLKATRFAGWEPL